MPVPMRAGVRVALSEQPDANVTTGVPVLDHLVGLLARYASLDVALEVAPESAEAEVAAAGKALGAALYEVLRSGDASGRGFAVLPVDEALAHVTLEVADHALVKSNVDLSDQRLGGLAADPVAIFLEELSAGAGIVLHVRLIEGRETEHVLEAIFKALGVALGQAARRAYEKGAG
jgi:imidazoleglycerol-phosphate dehydratase